MARLDIRPKLNAGDLADLAELKKELKQGAKPTPIGTIIGKVRALSFRNNPNDETKPSVALMGIFEGIPSDAKRGAIKSAACFIQPAALHDAIVNHCMGNKQIPVKKMPERGRGVTLPLENEVEFGVEVAVAFAKNAVGYTYVGELDMDDDSVGADPLEDLRKRMKLPVPDVKRLPAPKKKK